MQFASLTLSASQDNSGVPRYLIATGHELSTKAAWGNGAWSVRHDDDFANNRRRVPPQKSQSRSLGTDGIPYPASLGIGSQEVGSIATPAKQGRAAAVPVRQDRALFQENQSNYSEIRLTRSISQRATVLMCKQQVQLVQILCFRFRF